MINEYMDMKIPQSYITSRSLNNTEKSILFALRSQSIRGIKMNFPNMYSENSLCPMCERSPDTQQHLPLCTVLTNSLPIEKHMDYTYINVSVEQQREYVQVYKRYLELRDQLMESSNSTSLPVLHTGPMRPLAASRGQPVEAAQLWERKDFLSSCLCLRKKLILSKFKYIFFFQSGRVTYFLKGNLDLPNDLILTVFVQQFSANSYFPINRIRNRFAEATSVRIGIGIVCECQDLQIGIGIVFVRRKVFANCS